MTATTVEMIKQNALAAARAHEAAVAERERLYRLERMTDIVTALGEHFREAGDTFLEDCGIEMRGRGDGVVLFKAGWAFEIAPRDDMTVTANGAAIRPDPQFPVLTAELEGDIRGRIQRWAQSIDDGTAREVWP